MIYLYHCYRGAHMSVTAAALHLNIITAEATSTEILGLEYFDVLQGDEMGVPVLAGYDDSGNPVYFMGLAKGGKVFTQFASSAVSELKAELQYKSVDCLVCIHWLTRVGGFLSRYKLFRALGCRLAARGVNKNLRQIYNLVLQARQS